MVYEQTPYNKR